MPEPQLIGDVLKGLEPMHGMELGLDVLKLNKKWRKELFKFMKKQPELLYRLEKRTIGKKEREFAIPADKKFKELQRKIYTDFLKPLLIANGSEISFSSRPGKNIRLLGQRHLASFPTHGLILDLESAFPHVSLRHMEAALFRALAEAKGTIDNNFWFPKISMVVRLLAYKNRLPLGPSTSPALFELACLLGFDQELIKIGDKFGLTVTRYVDDIQITSSQKPISGEVVECVRAAASRCLFKLNEEKVRFFKAEARTQTLPMLGILLDMKNDPGLRLKPGIRERMRAGISSLTQELVFLSSCKEDEDSFKRMGKIVAGVLGRIIYSWGILKKDDEKFNMDNLSQRIPSRIFSVFAGKFLPAMKLVAERVKLARVYAERL